MNNALIVDEAFLEQVELFETLIKNLVAGRFGGNHKSKTFGASCEFADYREYVPGDDITKIDWNAYARFENLYLKLFLDERQVHTRIYIDASRSMVFGKDNKDVQALKIAAVLAYIAICEMDKVSIYVMRNDHVEEVITNMFGKESYVNNIGKLNDIVFDGETNISEAILPSTVGYGDGLSIIISDFLTDYDYETAINYLVGKKRDVLCVQILSKDELNPKARGKMHFFDSEDLNDYYRKNINRDIIRAYKAAVEYATDRIKNCCLARGGNYMLVSSDESLEKIIFDNLLTMGVLK